MTLTHGMAEVEAGLRLDHASAGAGERSAVLLHGFPQTWYEWRHALPPLVDAGFRAAAPDYRRRALGPVSRPHGMSEGNVRDRLARLRRERPWFAAIAALALAAVVGVVLVVDPLGNIVSALPLPDLPELPGLPGWADWLKLGVVIVLILVGAVGALARTGRDETHKMRAATPRAAGAFVRRGREPPRPRGSGRPSPVAARRQPHATLPQSRLSAASRRVRP
jgi:hypothetical protein